MQKKVIAPIVLAAVICAAGCGNGIKKSEKVQEVTYWVGMNSNVSMLSSNLGETPFSKKLQEVTGVKINYQHPPQGHVGEKFNIMVAGDDLPDIIEYAWSNYPGGVNKAISEKIIMPVNEHKELAPNFFKYASEHSDIDKLLKTDDGDYYAFPFIRGDSSLYTSAGLVLRSDWLKALNLEVPQTIDEWETVLTAFKEKKNASAPLSIDKMYFDFGAFTGAYGFNNGYFLDDGKVKYGPYEPGFKDFLIKMNDWYKKGLLDQSFATVDAKTIDSNILNGVSGATGGSIGSGIGRWMASKTDPDFELVGAPYPTLNKGTKPEFGQANLPVTEQSAAITRDCKNIETAYKLLDYGYGDEGRMLFNFGIENESYIMVDGYPTYMDNITKNADGNSMSAMLAQYCLAYDAGPFVQDKRYMEQYANLPEQQQAWKVWSDTNVQKHLLPYLYPSEEEMSEMSGLKNAITTYADEMMCKFIMGSESFDNYDEYINQLKTRGMDRVLEIYQSAYDRYMKR